MNLDKFVGLVFLGEFITMAFILIGVGLYHAWEPILDFFSISGSGWG